MNLNQESEKSEHTQTSKLQNAKGETTLPPVPGSFFGLGVDQRIGQVAYVMHNIVTAGNKLWPHTDYKCHNQMCNQKYQPKK